MNIIDVYTRAQAFEDGILVDVSAVAQEAGIKFPTAITRAVWDKVVEPDTAAKNCGESEQGRLWDVVYMLRIAARTHFGSIINYSLLSTKGGRRHKIELKAVCGPGDTLEPVITIMLPTED